MEDFVAMSGLNCADLTKEFSVEKNFSMWHRGCLYSILVKKVAAFCPCLKSQSEPEVKRFRSIALKREVSKQPSKFGCMVTKVHSL